MHGYGMSFAAIVDGLTVGMTPILPVVREFVLYEQSIGKREDDALAHGAKAFAVGFAEFLFLMRLCIAGAQFLSARWEGKSARYGRTVRRVTRPRRVSFEDWNKLGRRISRYWLRRLLRWVRLPPAARIQSPSSGTTRITRAQTRAKSLKGELCGD